jgi:hypothetical protein
LYCPQILAEPALLVTGYTIVADAAAPPPDPAGSESQAYEHLYLSCMMRLSNDQQGLSVRMPRDGGYVIVEHWDHKTREATRITVPAKTSQELDGSLATVTRLSALQTDGSERKVLDYLTQGYQAPENPSPVSDSESAPAEASNPSVEAPSSDQTNWLSQSGNNIAVNVDRLVSFTAWIAKEPEGGEIARSFFTHFTSEWPDRLYQHNQFQGQLKRQVELLQYGLPLGIIERQESRVGNAILSSHQLESWASSIQVLEFDAAICAQSPIPEGFQIYAQVLE